MLWNLVNTIFLKQISLKSFNEKSKSVCMGSMVLLSLQECHFCISSKVLLNKILMWMWSEIQGTPRE